MLLRSTFFCFAIFANMKIHFILVEPAVPENVGAAARAIKTMGFDSLCLVNPCEFSEGRAKWVAHASGEILDNAEVFSSLEEALKDMDFVVASSAKPRSIKGDHHPAEKLPELLRQKTSSVNSVAIVFGREESGLTNSEIELCHITTFIPMATLYPSLNLGQAVMVYAYVLSKLNFGNESPGGESKVVEPKFNAMINQTAAFLKETKIGRNPNIYKRIFERLSLLGDNDINLLMSVLSAIDKRKEQ